MVFDDTLRAGLGRRLSRADPGQPVQRRLLDPRHAAGSSRCSGSIRNTMYAAGMDVESAKGECNLGQHEIGFLYADALTTADNHAVYKNIAKEIAAQHGKRSRSWPSTTSARATPATSTCRCAARTDRWCSGTRRTATAGAPPLYDQFLAGVLATMPDLTLLYAPNINSYKRFAAGSFAPTTIAWGEDNRTCALRLVGRGPSARMENRVPGGDVNPYLALAAMIAGGLYGIEHGARAAAAELHRQRLHLRAADGAAHPAGGAGRLRRLGRSPGRASATRSSTTTPTWPTSSWPPSTPPSPTGNGGAASRGCDAVRRCTVATVINPATDGRGSTTVELADVERDRRRDRGGAGGASRPGVTSPRASGPGCCAGSPQWSTTISRSWPSSRSRNAGHTDRQRALGGRQRPRRAELLLRRARSGCSAGRSRCRAASTSPSTSRSAWSA